MKQKQSMLSLPDPLMVRNARIQSRGHKLWAEVLIFLLIFLISSVVELFLGMIPIFIGITQTPAFQEMMNQMREGTFLFSDYFDVVMQIQEQLSGWVMLAMLFATVGIIVTVLVYCTKIEKRRLSTLGLTKKRVVSEYLLGLGVGVVLFVLVMGLNLLFGGVTWNGLVFRSEMLPILLCTFLGYMVQGASEEILCRGYFCVSVARWMPLWVGMLINSIAFALLHLGNGGISPLALLNLFLFGIFMTVYMIRRGNLWGVCAIHSIWNFVQGNVFGLRVSGMGAENTIFRAEHVDGMAIWNGGAFGPEGGLCVTIVLVVAILVVFLFCKNRDLGQKADAVPAALKEKIG